MTTIPPLPSREDRDWLPWAQGVDGAARNAATKDDLAKIQLIPDSTGPKGDPGATGPQGPIGPQGPTGPQGSAGTNATVTDGAMAGALGPTAAAAIAGRAELKAAYVPALPSAGSYTYNADGTIASDPDGNSYTWNADGTPKTQTKGGVTRTFNWNTDGTLASVS